MEKINKNKKYKNPNDEECVLCNSELDEKYAGGIWDLVGTICDEILDDCEHEYQDRIYYEIRAFVEKEKYCPRCGAETKADDSKGGAHYEN